MKSKKTRKVENLITNGSFESGAALPDNWEWVVHNRRPFWRFDESEKFCGRRSVCIMQDIGAHHGEFRQVVKAKGGARYRLQGRIKGVIQGTGETSGANLNLTALCGGKVVGEMRYRPFLVGRLDWDLWSFEYVAPAETDALVVTLDMRNAAGAAWFDDVQLVEIPKPLWHSAPFRSRTACSVVATATNANMRSIESAAVFSDCDASFLANDVLAPLVGNVSVRSLGRFKPQDEGAILIMKGRRKGKIPSLTFAEVERLARKRTVIMNPAALAAAVEIDQVKSRTYESKIQPPGARILAEHPVTRGFAAGDVVPWFARTDEGAFAQVQIDAPSDLLQSRGFAVLATSATASAADDGRPLILYKDGGEGGGLIVMDLFILNRRPSHLYEENLAFLVLSNVIGRPQTSVGRYVAPTFVYDEYLEEVQALARRYPSVRLREEGRVKTGRPVVSLSIGPEDAPSFFVDCGIHPYEWAPTFGAVLYMARLAAEFEQGLPWAKAMLEGLQLKCVPVYSPDGFERLDGAVDGVNLNRNFPVFWDRYERADKGTAPLCAEETRIIADLLKREKFVAAVNWHETNAATNWVGAPGFEGQYRKYGLSVPPLFEQSVDEGLVFWHAALWTQNTDARNLEYHSMDSFPCLRDYGKSLDPFEIHYADSLGIDGLLVEQYGNSDVSIAATPQRTELTARIMEILFGLQIGLVCRNHAPHEKRFRLPLAAEGREAHLAAYDATGAETADGTVDSCGDAVNAECVLLPGGVLVVKLDPPPWRR